MRNAEEWKPSKILPTDGGWVSNPDFVGKRSRYVAELECKAYVKVLEENITGDLLDIGAGTVPYYGIYKDRTTSVICTDWSESLHDISHIDILADANSHLPFDNDSFDTIVTGDVLEHLSEPTVFFSESSRILKQNGKLIIFVPFMYWLHEEPYDYFRYTKHSLHHLAEKSGLTVNAVEEYGGGPDIFIDASQKMLAEKPIKYALANYVLSVIAKTKTFQNARDSHKQRFPLGYTFIATKDPIQ